MGRGWSKMARGACRTFNVVSVIERMWNKAFGSSDSSEKPKKRRRRRGGRNRRKVQTPITMTPDFVVAQAKAACGTSAGKPKWTFDTNLEVREVVGFDLCAEDVHVCGCVTCESMSRERKSKMGWEGFRSQLVGKKPNGSPMHRWYNDSHGPRGRQRCK